MRLMLPMSDSEKQALLQRAVDILQFGRLHAVREKARDDGALVISGKFTDSFGFVDHPRLTVRSSGELEEFRCDCGEFRGTHSLCGHCAALADHVFQEVCAASASAAPEDLPVPDVTPQEAPPVPLFPQTPPSVEKISYTFSNSRRDLYPGKDNPRSGRSRHRLCQNRHGRTSRAQGRP